MGITARPTKNFDLSKIDDIQNEYFSGEDNEIAAESEKKNLVEVSNAIKKNSKKSSKPSSPTARIKNEIEDTNFDREKNEKKPEIKNAAAEKPKAPENASIADLLATAKSSAVRYTSRPFTVPRSLTIDLNRLKTKFKLRDLHYTQNELIDKMIKESLATITADNYFAKREHAFEFIKSPEQCSRRSVTLTEETASEMAELKANLSLRQNRRISSDEIFTTLLAVAFAALYENGLIG